MSVSDQSDPHWCPRKTRPALAVQCLLPSRVRWKLHGCGHSRVAGPVCALPCGEAALPSIRRAGVVEVVILLWERNAGRETRPALPFAQHLPAELYRTHEASERASSACCPCSLGSGVCRPLLVRADERKSFLLSVGRQRFRGEQGRGTFMAICT